MDGSRTADDTPVRCLLIAEYMIGHVPFVDSLERAAAARADVLLDVVRLVPGPASGRLALPGSSNWSLRASTQARRRAARRWTAADVVLVHTQTAALLLAHRMRSTPTWISSDATPRNLDEVADAYGHRVSRPTVERAKRAVAGRAYRSAAGVVAWSSWVEDSLVRDYGVRPDRVHVVRPGARLPATAPRRAGGGPVRLLFVGGDFRRKGGEDLLQAFRRLRGDVELDVVTRTDVPAEARVRVHRGLEPGSADLLALYSAADVAVLPTRGDASPYAVVEAMAYGLPVVTTAVGAIAEAVDDGRTGRLVRPADPESLRAALQPLVDRPDLRASFGSAARARAEDRYDGARNADRLLDLLRDARGRRP